MATTMTVEQLIKALSVHPLTTKVLIFTRPHGQNYCVADVDATTFSGYVYVNVEDEV